MISVRKSDERGHFDHGWLDTRHTFSFAEYLDPRFMGFRDLRVINEDRVQAGEGFGTHGHRDMEIISYVLEGELAHRDSLGHGETLRPGEVQRMSAGTGIRHSEFNGSATAPLHFLQIWILPERAGLSPGYEQKPFPSAELRGRLRLVAAPDGSGGALTIHQDVRVYAGLLAPGERARVDLAPGRGAWVQVARGSVRVNGVELRAGDGAALEGEPALEVEGTEDAEVLAFDLR
ncbi:MAG TPA: pirin family protein [Anaeromyxobacteraceae bacterium]|nr:pirin family protein [Anaeromyxobacteraceae bacterium]